MKYALVVLMALALGIGGYQVVCLNREVQRAEEPDRLSESLTRSVRTVLPRLAGLEASVRATEQDLSARTEQLDSASNALRNTESRLILVQRRSSEEQA